jgi:sugar transferase (PEP-CTERM/EpsH1 system associated)
MRILFITPELPYPPWRGYQLRAWHQLRLLSRRHRITLICYAEADDSSPPLRELSTYCEEIIRVPYRPLHSLRAILAGMTRGKPLQGCIYETREMRHAIGRLLAERRHDVAHVQLVRMAGLLEGETSIPRVIDLVDALSLNLRRRASFDRGPLRQLARTEANRLRRYEREICRSWDRAIVVSPLDRAAIGDFAHLLVNPSGVDLEEFSFHREGGNPHEILFTGNLGYFSNVDAISWFAREIFPPIAHLNPRAILTIVGARPDRKVRALAKLDRRITVTGFVEKLPPFLHRCAVAIAPMRAGSGQLFKVLEAMACGAPMVVTPVVADALPVENGRHLMIADAPEQFAEAVLRLMREEALASHLAREAHALVESRYQWEQSVSELEAIYHSVVEFASTHHDEREPRSEAAAS